MMEWEIKMYAVWKYHNRVFSISENCRGGDLHDFAEEIKDYPRTTKEILCLIYYLKILKHSIVYTVTVFYILTLSLRM